MADVERTESRANLMFPTFSEVAMRETRALHHDSEIFSGRRLVQGITIDSATSKDLDDAIWVEKLGKGYRVSVSIADVSALIPANSALDKEAQLRGFTRYYLDKNNPMLPRNISEDLLSLHEHTLKPTITITTPLDENLDMGKPTFELTKLESNKRFNYEEMDSILTDKKNAYREFFYPYGELAIKLLAKRREKGALAFYDLSKGIATNEEGIPQQLTEDESHISNIIIQEFMILTNRSVALHLAEKQVPTLFRNHKARPSASSRRSLIADIENAIDHPKDFDVNVLRRRMGVIFDRARYGPMLEGHFGLNLEAYLHFTSPIRRYADLVNHRILTSVIKNENPPYSMEELTEIGNQLNTIYDSIQKQKSEHFRNPARQEIKPASANLDTKENVTSNPTANNFIERLKENKLNSHDIFVILTKPHDENEVWQNVIKEIMTYLKENPHHAVSIAMLGSQNLGWSTPSYETTFEGPDHARVFTSTAKIVVNKVDFVSEPITAPSKKTSEQLAAFNILPKILGMKVPEQQPEITQSVISETVIFSQGKDPIRQAVNFKNAVQEICQERGWNFPSYQVEQEGPSHLPTFRAKAVLKVNGREIISDEVIGQNRRDAEKAAAENLLEKLGEESLPTQRTEKIEGPIEVVDENYVGGLQTFISRHHWKMPKYGVSQVGKSPESGFECTVTVKMRDGTEKTLKSYGSTHKSARQNAAQIMLEGLTKS